MVCTFGKNGSKADAAAQEWYSETLSRVQVDFPSVCMVDISRPLCTDGLCHLKIDGDLCMGIMATSRLLARVLSVRKYSPRSGDEPCDLPVMRPAICAVCLTVTCTHRFFP